tara:strand:- start:81 stop:377 length:297 start_codon:yes stop_codon:yes gene_type:complete
MGSFWTCGPFKEAQDRLDRMIFKSEQMKHLLDLIEEIEHTDQIISKGDPNEILLANLMKLDIEQKLDVLLGINNGNKEKDDEVSREALLESIFERTKV